jgi:hypothetical protein
MTPLAAVRGVSTVATLYVDQQTAGGVLMSTTITIRCEEELKDRLDRLAEYRCR